MNESDKKQLLAIARLRLQNRPGTFEKFEFELVYGGITGLAYYLAQLAFLNDSLSALGSVAPEIRHKRRQENMIRAVDEWAARQPTPGPLKVEALPAQDESPVHAPAPTTLHAPRSLAGLSARTQSQSTTPAPVVAERASNAPVVPFKKAALVAAHVHEWPTIESDISDAATNGLAATAKAGARGWREDAALIWARANGKLISAAKPADSLAQAMHTLSALPSRKHTMQG